MRLQKNRKLRSVEIFNGPLYLAKRGNAKGEMSPSCVYQLCCWFKLLGFYRKICSFANFIPDHPPQSKSLKVSLFAQLFGNPWIWLTPCGPPSLKGICGCKFSSKRVNLTTLRSTKSQKVLLRYDFSG